MPGPRLPLPTALDVFPTLKRFPAMRPRRIAQVPVGCPNAVDARQLRTEDAQRCLRHLYHDLGVLAFAGCSPAHVRRIGDVLREVVSRGGPGGLAVALNGSSAGTSRRRDKALAKTDLYEALDVTRAGVVKPEALLRLASSRLQELLQAQIADSGEKKKIHIREAQVLLPGSPQPRGTILQTVSGPRRLPIESFASVGISPANGRTSGKVQFYAAGTGEYVGGASIDYVLLRYDDEEKAVRSYWAHGKLGKLGKAREGGDREAQRRALDDVSEAALRPLWEMEREVWAARAQQLLEHKVIP